MHSAKRLLSGGAGNVFGWDMGQHIRCGVIYSGIWKERTGSRQHWQDMTLLHCTSGERQFDDTLVGVSGTQQCARFADFVVLQDEESYVFELRLFLTKRWIMSNLNP